ncbi:hypothetical protein KEM56_000060, partial [Ascosphaera pollenicola]
MSTIPPAKEDIWDYENSQFFVTVNSQDKKPQKHRRASARELNALFHPSPGQPPKADPTAHWYNAQCLHYGLKPSGVKGTAHKRLLEAFNKEHLIVPSWIRKIERKLKRVWDAQVAESQALSRRGERRANPEQSVRKTKKRKVSSNPVRDPEVIVIDDESSPPTPESSRVVSTAPRVRSTGDPQSASNKRKRDKEKEPVPRPGSILDTLPILVHDSPTPADGSRQKKQRRDGSGRFSKGDGQNGVTDMPAASTYTSANVAPTLVRQSSATSSQRASISPLSTSSSSSSSSSELSDDDLPLLPSRHQMRPSRPAPPAQPPQRIPTVRATAVTPPHSPSKAPYGPSNMSINRDVPSQRPVTARNTMRVPYPKLNTRPLPNGAPSQNDPNRLRKSATTGNVSRLASSSGTSPTVANQPARISVHSPVPRAHGTAANEIQTEPRSSNLTIQINNRYHIATPTHPAPKKPQLSAVQPTNHASQYTNGRSSTGVNPARQQASTASKPSAIISQVPTSAHEVSSSANVVPGPQSTEPSRLSTARRTKPLQESVSSSTLSEEAVAAMARFQEQARSTSQDALPSQPSVSKSADKSTKPPEKEAINKENKEQPPRTGASASVSESADKGTGPLGNQVADKESREQPPRTGASASVQQNGNTTKENANESAIQTKPFMARNVTTISSTSLGIPEGAIVFRPAHIKAEPDEVASAAPSSNSGKQDAPRERDVQVKTESTASTPVPRFRNAADMANQPTSARPEQFGPSKPGASRCPDVPLRSSSSRGRAPYNPPRWKESDIYHPSYNRPPSPPRNIPTGPARYVRERRESPMSYAAPPPNVRRGPEPNPAPYGRPLLDSWVPSYSDSSRGSRPASTCSSEHYRCPSPPRYPRYWDEGRDYPPSRPPSSWQRGRPNVDTIKHFQKTNSPNGSRRGSLASSRGDENSRPSYARRNSGVNNASETQNRGPSPPRSAESRPDRDRTASASDASTEKTTSERDSDSTSRPQQSADSNCNSRNESKDSDTGSRPSNQVPTAAPLASAENAANETVSGGSLTLSAPSGKENAKEPVKFAIPQAKPSGRRNQGSDPKADKANRIDEGPMAVQSTAETETQIASLKKPEIPLNNVAGSVEKQNVISVSHTHKAAGSLPLPVRPPSPQGSVQTEGSAAMDISPSLASASAAALVPRAMVLDKTPDLGEPLHYVRESTLTDAVFNCNVDEPVHEAQSLSNDAENASVGPSKPSLASTASSIATPSCHLGKLPPDSNTRPSGIDETIQRTVAGRSKNDVNPNQEIVENPGKGLQKTADLSSPLEQSNCLKNRVTSPNSVFEHRSADPDNRAREGYAPRLSGNANRQLPALFLSSVDDIETARSYFNQSENASITNIKRWGKFNLVVTFSSFEVACKAYNHQPRSRKIPRHPGEARTPKVMWFEERPPRWIQSKSSHDTMRSEGRESLSGRHGRMSSNLPKSREHSQRNSVEADVPPVIGRHSVHLPGDNLKNPQTPTSTNGSYRRLADAPPILDPPAGPRADSVSTHGIASRIASRAESLNPDRANVTPPSRTHI